MTMTTVDGFILEKNSETRRRQLYSSFLAHYHLSGVHPMDGPQYSPDDPFGRKPLRQRAFVPCEGLVVVSWDSELSMSREARPEVCR